MQPSLVKYRYPQLERTVNADTAGALRRSPRFSKSLLSTSGVTAEDLLDSILPPREWTENGQVWTQRVSSTPATRADVVAVEEELDKRLKQQGARDFGICSTREHLYSQCFDELLRQVAVACAERGLLLHRVRTELSTMVKAYQKVYESSATFGMRKALQLDDRKTAVNAALEALRQKKEQLVQEAGVLQEYCAKIKQSSRENIDQVNARLHQHTQCCGRSAEAPE